MVATYQDLGEFLSRIYGFRSTVRCIHCYTAYCNTNRIDILKIDQHLHCCSEPYVLFYGPKDSPLVSGVFNIGGNLLVLGLEFTTTRT